MDLQAETEEVLRRLIRFNTVNPPGNERELQEWLKGYLEDAGLECELAGADPERPNLVARLPGEEPGPVLGYLSHVDTVLADPDDWSRDPWGGETHDGFLFGRGALDMKNQTAAEVVAAAHLARQGWRPPRGELKVFSVVDEEVGGRLGAKWLCRERPDLARCDYLLNEGGGARMPLGDGCLYGVEVAEKGVLRFKVVTRGTAAHASVPAFGDNALLKLGPVLERFGSAPPRYVLTEQTRVRCSRASVRTPSIRRRRSRRCGGPTAAWPTWSPPRWVSPSRRPSSRPRRRSTSSRLTPSCRWTAACRRA